MKYKVKPVRVTCLIARQGMLAPVLPAHQGIHFQKGGKDFGVEGKGASVERCRFLCWVGHGLCCHVTSQDFPGSVCCCQGLSHLLCVVLTIQCMCVCACSVLGAPALL